MADNLPAEISEALPDESQRIRYTRFVDLMRLLGDCLIASDYVIPDGMASSIRLTQYGESILTKVATTKTDRVPAKEARLMCALAVGRERLLVDVEETDIDALANSMSEQIISGRIRFPFAFGRDSYDSYAAMFDEGQPLLTYEETQRFLDDTPIGVHQYGSYVTGPYGLHESASVRQVHSGPRIEAFHCSDVMCDVVHRVHLTTSSAALINKHREKFNEVFPADDTTNIDWFGAADDIRDVDAIMFSDASVGVVATLLGDGLSLDELRRLVAHLFDETSGQLREAVAPFLRVLSAAEAVGDLDRAQLMQIALLAKEASIQTALDALIESEDISVKAGEVRRPVVNRERRSGAFGLMPEAGHLGARFISQDPGFATLRLRDELTGLYDLTDNDDRTELEWLIRAIDGETLDERLDTFFRTSDPAECVRRLVLPRRSGLQRVAKRLRIKEGLSGSDEEIVARILWKLGFPLHDEQDPRSEFWRLHQRLSGLTKVSHSPGARDTEEFLGVASKFFRELERFLSESLAFTAWALRHDHTQDGNPFEFGLEADFARGMQFVQEAADAADDRVQSFNYVDEKLDIYTMIRGFEFLSKHLAQLQSDVDAFRRPSEQFPSYSRGSRLKRFPFTHSVPFLNLTERSQNRIIAQLRGVSQSLLRGKVNDIRNDHQHYRKTVSGVEQIESALREIEFATRSLETAGFGLVEFRVDDAIHDRWGRSEFYFAAPRGARHVVTRPSSYDWLGLPELERPQYVVTSAVFAEPNEVLRFRRRLDSEYTFMWSEYPSRRRPRGSALSQNSVEHPGAEVRGS